MRRIGTKPTRTRRIGRLGNLGATLLALALVLAGCGVATVGSGGATTSGSGGGGEPGGDGVHSISVGGLERSYILTPPTADGAALVVVLHGGFGSAAQAQESYGWDELAASEGFALAYADGIRRTWNAGGCCGPAQMDGVDDVAFLTKMIDEIAGAHSIDPDRIYVTGMSNGGMMAYRLACETDRVAAIAAVATTMVIECDDPAPLSVLHVHGEADTSVPMDGSPGAGPGDVDGTAIPALNEFWRTVDECAAPTVTVEGLVTSTLADCADGRAVDLITIAGAGHQWPGSETVRSGADTPSAALDATATAWAFFEAHPRV